MTYGPLRETFHRPDSMFTDRDALKRRFIRWLEDNRGLILTLIGLPASFMFDLVMQVSEARKPFPKK